MDNKIVEEKIFNWILIRKDTQIYIDWANGIKPNVGEPDLLEWIEWNKPIPPDAGQEGVGYIYDKDLNELVKQ